MTDTSQPFGGKIPTERKALETAYEMLLWIKAGNDYSTNAYMNRLTAIRDALQSDN